MLKRHSDFLDNTLDRLAHEAVVELSKAQLKHICKTERLSKNAWRDLFDRLPEGVSISDLKVIEHNDAIYLIDKKTLGDASAYI